jgi:hypothetical protein
MEEGIPVVGLEEEVSLRRRDDLLVGSQQLRRAILEA